MIALNMRGWISWGVWLLLTAILAGYIYSVPKHGGSAEVVAIFAVQLAIVSSVLGLVIKAYLIQTKPSWAWRAIWVTSFSVIFVAMFMPRIANEVTGLIQKPQKESPSDILADVLADLR